ncbi:hypothetical protein AQJ30_15515 [Streptomyces longwoodensis]|uniref:Uncharacterized protein n=1 Tax=Streptomyces longwoodensis TaxID=68231 RepID=A0A117QN93_9ACTN|nr:hypothetical protein [Streptomyces longwoodensis]KUN37691.1 hypothetical protein AQJ30_15515 [Streptomyces longwoodensis]
MSGVGVQFVGGPADGRLLAIPGDPWNPPHTYELRNPDGDRLMYVRALNPGDDGPLWHYRYDRTVNREARAT